MSEQTHPDVTNVDCTICEHVHTHSWPHVCRDIHCDCDNDIFLNQLKEQQVKNMSHNLTSSKAKAKLLLEQYPKLKNVSNKHFAFAYLEIINGVALTDEQMARAEDPEHIVRMRREVVFENPGLAPNEPVLRERILKERKIHEYYRSKK